MSKSSVVEETENEKPDTNTIEIKVNDDFSGGNVLVSKDLCDILGKYRGKKIVIRTNDMDIHIVLKPAT